MVGDAMNQAKGAINEAKGAVDEAKKAAEDAKKAVKAPTRVFRRGGWLTGLPPLVLPPKHRPFTVGFSLCEASQPSLRAIRSGTTPSVQSWPRGHRGGPRGDAQDGQGAASLAIKIANRTSPQRDLRFVREFERTRVIACPVSRVYDVGMRRARLVRHGPRTRQAHPPPDANTPDLKERVRIALEAGARMCDVLRGSTAWASSIGT